MYSVREVVFRADAHSNHTGSFAQCKGKTANKPQVFRVFFETHNFFAASRIARNFLARRRAGHVMLFLGQQTKGE